MAPKNKNEDGAARQLARDPLVSFLFFLPTIGKRVGFLRKEIKVPFRRILISQFKISSQKLKQCFLFRVHNSCSDLVPPVRQYEPFINGRFISVREVLLTNVH